MRSLTIMVVDDELALTEAIAELLRLDGHDVLTAGCAHKALELSAARPVDLVISDLMMPEMSGAALHAAMRAHGYGPTWFVLMSAAPESAVQRAVPHADGYLTKPLRLEKLRAVIAECANAVTQRAHQRG